MTDRHYDVLIVGAGISGISAAYYMQDMCPNKSFVILEGRDKIGGTWDLFKYPGIRSDSDMYTLGFAFRPWTSKKAIADGPSIMTYLHETIKEYNLDEKIILNQFIKKASWSTEKALWTLEVQEKDKEGPTYYTCNFLSMCSGYYDYKSGYMPEFKGVDDYTGMLIHPQQWPENLDYTDKKVVVIGSGATAVTLVPELAKKAKHVTMLQRSPTYVVSAPDEDKIANFTNKVLPAKIAYSISRWRKILFQRFNYALARKFPKTMKKLIVAGVKKEMGDDYDLKHFWPSYDPWDQRVCLVPNADLFTSIKEGKSEVVTDHIETFTEDGITLQSGETLQADIIVSATGLNMQQMGGVLFEVDGEAVDFAKTVAYKSVMFSGLPNVSLAFGYTNASWTLKCDLTNQYVCRLINHMDKHGYSSCTPTIKDENMELLPFLDFTSGYVMRYLDKLPRSGTTGPWKLKHNYIHDRMTLNRSKLADEFMVFA